MHSITIRGVFSSRLYGGHAQGIFGCAGFLMSRSTNLRMATTHSFGSEVGWLFIYDIRSLFMFKVTPNPPTTHPVPHDASLDPRKLKEAADRALNFYLNPGAPKEPIPPRSSIYLIDPAVDDETLLVQTHESLASASVMASDIADSMDGPQRKRMLILQQVIKLNELAVNRVLDNHKPG